MKKFKTLIVLLTMLLALNVPSAFAEGEDSGQIHLWDFNEITNINEYSEFSNANWSARGITSTIDNGTLKYSKKNGTKQHIMSLNLADYVSEINTYMAEFDLKAEFEKNKNFILRCGSNIQFVAHENGEYSVQRLVDGSFVTENTKKYNLSSFQKVAFVVRGKSTVDLYIGSTTDSPELVYENMEFTNEDSLKFIFNASSDGIMYIDNIRLTTTVPIKKDITNLKFKNCGDSIDVDLGDTLKIEIDAQADSGIERVDIYAGSEKYATLIQAPFIADLSNAGNGAVIITAEAVSNAGDSLTKTLEVNYRNDAEYPIFSDSEFESDSASALKSGIQLYPRRGYIKSGKIDEEHGASLLVGIDNADTTYTDADVPYANIPISGYEGRIRFDCDLYVDNKENSGQKNMIFRLGNGKETNIIRFKDPQMLVANSVSMDYDTGRWYHLTVKINTITCRIEIFVDHMPIIQYTLNSEPSSSGLVRLYGPSDDTIKSFTAIDNINIKGYYDVPTVTAVEDGNDISPDKAEITEYLSSPLYDKSISAETVRLLDEDGNECPIEKAFYNGSDYSVTVVPKKALMPDSEYKIVISADAQFAKDVPVGEEVEGVFKTAPSQIRVEHVQIKKEASLCKADVRIKNVTDSEKTVYVVMTLWQNEKGIDMKISPLTLAPNSTDSVELETALQNANIAEVYIYNDLTASEYLFSRIYKKEF